MTTAYWCLLILILYPIAIAAYAKHLGGFRVVDNKKPREFLANTTGRAARAHAIQLNSYEIFPPFAATVIIAHQLDNASQMTIDVLAVSFMLTRLVFGYCYLSDKPFLRSIAFGMGIICIIGLFIASA